MGTPNGQNGLVATAGPMKGLHAGMGIAARGFSLSSRWHKMW